MGAMLSATELAFGKTEVRSADSMSHALVRIGVMGGLTMVCMNILGYARFHQQKCLYCCTFNLAHTQLRAKHLVCFEFCLLLV
eukprot:2153677-Rhodomonas_salina.2